MRRLIALLPLALSLACGDKGEDTAADSGHDHDDHDMDTDADTDTDTEVGDQAVAFTITPLLGEVTPACGASLEGIGASGATAELMDFRFYVHDLRLLTADGAEVPVTLDDDGAWQDRTVALLDYEDATGRCSNGTSAMNDTVRGMVPEGDYVGARFVLGVPFELNHADPAAAASPLNQTSLHWNWQGGYKFIRLDLSTGGQPDGWFVHLGSTGCAAEEDGTITGCAQENRVEVEVSSATEAVLDLDQLYEGSDVDVDEGGAKGCMSGLDDPECGPILTAFGLTGDAPTQSVFTAP